MPPIQLLFGPMLVGTYLNTILYGVMVMQMFVYYQTYKKDSAWFRYFVFYLFVAETLNTGFDIGMMYEPLVLRYGTPAATTFFPLMLAADPIMTVLISTPIQIFIAWRIRIISEARWLAAIICIFALIAMGGGMWTTITVTVVRRYANKPELHWPALTWLLASAIADVLITTSLVFSLSRRKTGFTGTDDAIHRIIRLTIQTGMVTAFFAAADVIFFLVLPHTTLNFVWDFALSKLYTNALISTLNARAGWSDIAEGHTTHNVLFGDESKSTAASGRFVGTYPSTTFRRTNPHMVSTGVYELEPSSTTQIKSDVEYNITVTKDIERLENPIPTHHLTQ